MHLAKLTFRILLGRRLPVTKGTLQVDGCHEFWERGEGVPIAWREEAVGEATREVLRLEQKSIIDRIKMTAYNAEEWLLELLVQHYPNSHDVRALLRSFAKLAGEIRTTPTEVVITLDAPDLPLHCRALHGLCADLNQLGATYPGSDLPLHYYVAVHHSEAVA